MIERIVNKEVSGYKKAWAQEKENLVNRYNEEILRRDKHIKMLTDSIRNFEVENKHLLEVVYAKDREVSQIQKHLGTYIL